MALKSCTEIQSAKTLFQFMLDLSGMSKIPSFASQLQIVNDKQFLHFLKTVIICTEEGYSDTELKEIANRPHTLDYKMKYIDLITQIIKELLISGKAKKL
jgi:hypothetical protein